MKSNAIRVLGAVTLAGAFLTAATPAAQAQHVSFGVSVGPRYVEPAPLPPRVAYGYAPRAYYGPAYVDRRFEDRRFFEEQRRREELRRHEEWLRYHHSGYGYYGR